MSTSHNDSDISFDYVIVGSGAAGSLLADRLSRDPSVSVLLLEAGGSDRNPMHLVPKAFFFTMTHPWYTKSYVTEPDAEGNTKTLHRGRILGGSTTVNGMMWNRGWTPDYDAWERAGNTGWNWPRFLAAFKALESHEMGMSSTRGGDGPVPISIAKSNEPVTRAFIEALGKHGVSFVEDVNSTGDERVGFSAFTVRRGTRVSAARTFLRGARRRRNLTILTRAEADRITFDGTIATGVQVRRRGRTIHFGARREVLVCAGALESPLLLERSGIGDPRVLSGAGVAVRVASPKVGANLQDHRGCTFHLRLREPLGYNAEVNNALKRGWTGFKFLFTRAGVMSYGGFDLLAVIKSDPAAPHPDTSVFFTPISASRTHPRNGRFVVDAWPGAMLTVSLIFPTSKGSIHITGPSLKDKPRIVPNAVSTDYDCSMSIAMIKKAREIVATEPFARLVETEVVPGDLIHDDADALRYATKNGGVGVHTLGTCAIGPDDGDVVDDRLRVRGVSKLRVVDASVFPAPTSGNNSGPTQAMAWIAADLILQDAQEFSAANG
ncbi:GMC family oxidoreductase [uncultured Jatrophihabitans sp.]|uniref:GMC family oxidoreductase n=1 Tax=uncultured Jatrophihabitans sp. TaxID=1610747 RepID=UPI0035CC1CF0